MSPFELFHGKSPKILKGLIQFGRVGYVTIRDKFKSKFSPKSKRCLMVGYADDHQYNVYRMFNPSSRKIILSRDVVWGAWERMNSHSDKRVNTFKISKLIEEKAPVENIRDQVEIKKEVEEIEDNDKEHEENSPKLSKEIKKCKTTMKHIQ